MYSNKYIQLIYISIFQIVSISVINTLFSNHIYIVNSIIITSSEDQSRIYCNTNGSSSYIIENIDTINLTRKLITNNCPNHYSVCQDEGCSGSDSTFAIQASINIIFELPLYPRYSVWLVCRCV